LLRGGVGSYFSGKTTAKKKKVGAKRGNYESINKTPL